MPRYKVIDPKGIPHGEKTVGKGEFINDASHSARVRAWLRFGQIELAKEAEPKAAEPDAPEVSDAARKLAEEHGIDLSKVSGTGANGAVIKPDVEAFIAAAK